MSDLGLGLGTPEWGIFDQDGGPILTADSVFGMEYTREHRISDYPQEKGAFESYNKVRVPYQAKVTFTISGSDADRGGFFDGIETAVASLDLVSVVTPEVSYASANVYRYTYQRAANNGAKVVKVDVWCEEVRVVSAAEEQAASGKKSIPSTEAQSSSGVSTQNDGSVQATPANPLSPTPLSVQPPSGSVGAGAGVVGSSFDVGNPIALDPITQGVIVVPF